MKISIAKYILLLAVAFGTATVMAQSSDAVVRDKLTSAVMKVYDDHLAQNPNDYNVLFARAHQNFYNGDYTAALADVNQAMLLTPRTDKELRFDEYILRARIYDARQEYTNELADLHMAQELEPKSLPCTDMIAKAGLKTGNLDAAEKAFKTILRAESMNYDAMYGLAQVEQARGNAKAALEHVNKAVGLFRAEPEVYVNRADIYAKQGDFDAAVQDLIKGMTVGDGGDAAQRLFELSDVNYDAVMRSLAVLGEKNNDSGMYRYLRANVAIDHNRYGQALKDLDYIKRYGLYNSPTLYYNLAKCYLELARYDEAITNIDRALSMSPQQPEYYVLKSLAEYNTGDGGRWDAAMEALDRCSAIAPQYTPMLVAKASLLSSRGMDNEALGYLNAAVANDANDAEALLARGLLLKRLGNIKLADRDFNTLSLFSDNVHSLKGFALSELGRENEAFRWLQNVSAAKRAGGENLFYAALFMARRGDNYKAMDYLQRAINDGYGSLYKLRFDELSPLNLKSLRSESGFDLLIEKARRNFMEED